MWGQAASLALPRLRPPRHSLRLSRCSLCTSSPSRFALTPTRGELNQFGVDQLPKSLQRLLFQSVETKQGLSKEELQSALKELHKFGLTPESGQNFDIPDVSAYLPMLKGGSVSQHLRMEASRQSQPYVSLLCGLLVSTPPPMPQKWQPVEGWVRYAPGKPPTRVDHPLEHCMVFDVEVCVTADPRAVIAVAVTPKAWYCWLSPHLLNSTPFPPGPPTADTMVPLGSDSNPRLVVGHNVSYDRIRLGEEYRLEGSGTRFLDTMALHIAVAGMTSSQRLLMLAAKNLSAEELTHKPKWLKRTSMNGLKDVHKFWTGSKESLNKETRNAFVTDSLEELRVDLDNLVAYCASDVAATLEVAKIIFPRFLSKCPHPATLAGMLTMSTGFLPTSKCWDDFQEQAEAAYRDLEKELMLEVESEAREALKSIMNYSYKKDLWLWDLEWKLASKRTIKGRILSEIHKEDEMGNLFSAGFPAWYQDLADTDHENQPVLNLSTSKRAVPKLLRLTWQGYPLHHHKKYKWGYLVPTKGIDNVLEQVQLGNIETEFPLEEYVEFLSQAKNSTQELQTGLLASVEGVQEMELNTMDDFPEAPLPGRKSSKKEDQQAGVDIGIPGVRFIKLPHKKGPKFNVGNPLAKDFMASVGEGGALASLKREKLEKLMKGNMSLSYWRSTQARIKEQVKVDFPKDDAMVEESWGAILPSMVVSGTITRRAVEKTWLTASNAKSDRIGSELKSYIRAPPGYHLVGADVDQQELWLASVMGDAQAGGHGATPLGWMTLQGEKGKGTDVHSKTAAAAQVTRDQAKILNYARIYGAGEPFARSLLMQFNSSLSEEEAAKRVKHMYLQTKGERGYKLNQEGLWLQGLLGGSQKGDGEGGTGRQELFWLGKLKAVLERLVVAGEQNQLSEEGRELYLELRPDMKEEDWSLIDEEELGKLLRHVVQHHGSVLKNTTASYDTRESLVHQTIWSGGSESHTFNQLEALAMSDKPATPVLGAGITQALDTQLIGRNFLTSRINWVVQSSAVDYLHLLLVSVNWLFSKLKVSGRYVLSIHDEVRFMVRSEDRYRAALALHLANLLVRAEVVAQLGLDNMPASGAFFSSVDVDTVMRKEPSEDCVTPSNPLGLEKGHGIAKGEGLDIWAVLEKVKEEEAKKMSTDQTEETEVMKRLDHYREVHEVKENPKNIKSKSRRRRNGESEAYIEPADRWRTLSGTPKP